ncbi:MAG: antibiotic biosynthesis monooxygenase [Gammaproteobacteria bacterium]|nr:antibiotic biosynthesis monooxygenase [Gammaproteobacteria bacterium]NCF83200.1 antibiotic biosynthesis monooxygenase [Pseudomonadota bacterium]
MLAVIFEVEMNPGRDQDYFALAGSLRPELEAIDGFISVERFRSVTNESKYVSLSFWRDEEAVKKWREHAEHRVAQAQGKKTIIADFRIRVAEVVRDYTLADSRA